MGKKDKIICQCIRMGLRTSGKDIYKADKKDSKGEFIGIVYKCMKCGKETKL